MKTFTTIDNFISVYFEELISNIVEYGERQLKKYVKDEEGLLDKYIIHQSGRYPSVVELDSSSSTALETYGIAARIDPYTDQYSYNKIESIDPKTIRVRDYLNLVRILVVEELKRAWEEVFISYEADKTRFNLPSSNSTSSNLSSSSSGQLSNRLIDELKRKVFQTRFAFLLEVDQFKLKRCDNENQSVFKYYTVVSDFYLSKIDIKTLKSFLFNDDAKMMSFNTQTYLLFLASNYISGYLRKFTYGSQIIRLEKSTLCAINKISINRQYFYHLDQNEKDFDLSSIKSLTHKIVPSPRYHFKLDSFFNLEYLNLTNVNIIPNMFDCLPHLEHITLESCIFPLDSEKIFSRLSNLEYLNIYLPELVKEVSSDFGFDLREAVSLKWLSLKSDPEKPIGSANQDLLRLLPLSLVILDIRHIFNSHQKFDLDDLFRDVRLPDLLKLRLDLSNSTSLRNDKRVKSKWFSGFYNLKELELSVDNAKSIESNMGTCLPDLEKLTLYVSSLDTLRGLNTLKSLRIETKSMNNSIRHIRSLPNVERIRIKCVKISELNRRTFSDLSSLKMLDLNNDYVERLKSKTFTNLCQLQRLDLSGNEIRNLGRNVFAKHKSGSKSSLIKLDLGYNKLVELKKKTFSGLNQLEMLFLNDNQLAKIHPNSFSGSNYNLGNLLILDLTHNQIRSLKEDTFTGLDRLEVLLLGSNQLDRIRPNVFSANLVRLDLSFNRLEDLGSDVFSRLSRLQVLRLNNNELKRIHKNAFVDLESLKELNLHRNQLRELDPNWIRGLNLDYLDISRNHEFDESKLDLAMFKEIAENVKNINLKSSISHKMEHSIKQFLESTSLDFHVLF